ncbi:MAG: outer membrane protein [Rhizobiaceae bacterium]
MFRSIRPILLAGLLAGICGTATAADLYDPPVVETPPPVTYEPEVVEYGGWYIRGDLDYHMSTFKGAEYITYGVTGCCAPLPGTGTFDFGDLKGAFSVGGGVGYQVNKYLRADLTVDYMFGSEFTGQTTGWCGAIVCRSVDRSSYSALLMMANAYVDIGTWHGFTPYLGAGIGGAHVKWKNLENTVGGITTTHEGAKGMRFAWALMAGTSYCLTDKLKLDVGYRYARINGGRMFELAPAGPGGAGPGFDEGFNIHEGRAGLRYQFGGASGCHEPEPLPYEPEPIYTK